MVQSAKWRMLQSDKIAHVAEWQNGTRCKAGQGHRVRGHKARGHKARGHKARGHKVRGHKLQRAQDVNQHFWLIGKMAQGVKQAKGTGCEGTRREGTTREGTRHEGTRCKGTSCNGTRCNGTRCQSALLADWQNSTSCKADQVAKTI